MLALTDVNVLVLQRKDFDLMLGPLQKLLEVQIASYGSSKADKPLQAIKVSLWFIQIFSLYDFG